MAEHYIQTHKGEDHVSSDDVRAMWACLLGKDRAIAAGWEEEMAVTVPSMGTLHVGTGFALVDGGWYRIDGSGVDLEIPSGSIGMNRMDRVYARFVRGADDIEDMKLRYVTGNPTTGTPLAPSNEHPGNILDGDATVWAPFCDLPISGLTVGKPVMLMGKRALSPPVQQCVECKELMASVSQAVADCRSAEARAIETVRANEATLAEINRKQAEWAKKMERLDEYEHELADFAQILANNLGSYMILGSKLVVPTKWREYDPETHTIKLKYAEQDGTSASLAGAPTVASRQQETQDQTDVNTAEIDFLKMMRDLEGQDEQDEPEEPDGA